MSGGGWAVTKGRCDTYGFPKNGIPIQGDVWIWHYIGCRVQELGFVWGFPKLGVPFWELYSKDYGILGTYWVFLFIRIPLVGMNRN